MLILVGFGLMFCMGMFLLSRDEEGWGVSLSVVGGVGLASALLVTSAMHIEAKGRLAHYNEVIVSIENMQDANVSESEVIVLSQKIIEVNTFIAEVNAYNDGLLDIFIPDKVAELEPIRYGK